MKKSSRSAKRIFHLAGTPVGGWLDRLVGFQFTFGRFFRDALGLLLIALALMTLLARWGVTQGALLTPLSQILSRSFGWGSYLLVLGVAYAGFLLIRRSSDALNWGRFFALELALLLSLGLLSLLGGNDLARIELGLDGGYVGWGLVALAARLAGETWGAFLLVALWILLSLTGFGFWSFLERWLMHLAGTSPDGDHLLESIVQESMPRFAHDQEKNTSRVSADHAPAKRIKVHTPMGAARAGIGVVSPAQEVGRTSAPKKPVPLPPEFRVSLRAPEKKGERSSRPVTRPESLPSLDILLAESPVKTDERTVNQTAGLIMKTLAEFGIPATVIGYRVGPAVTQFAVQPGFIKKPGVVDDDAQQMKVRVAQIASLEKDLALALSAGRLRIEAPVPGKPYVGIEVPNTHSTVVRLKPLLESEPFHKHRSPLTLAIGRDVSGQPVIADLARMPHLLIAGATGSGKSVSITSMAACLAMNNTPRDLRLVMIDSKMVELLRFNGLPHLYGKVETNLERILGVLRWVVLEMEHRYRLLEASHSRDLEAYNRKVARKSDDEVLPRIVVMIDELADLMMSAPDQTEHSLVRLAQMARATGIHLVVATQRPSTDVVTGLIKANFPARLAFSVASGIDSRVILDLNGAETLLGRGDLLLLNPEVGNPVRAQGIMVSDIEIERIISHWQKSHPELVGETPPWERLLQEPQEDDDESLVAEAISLVRSSGHASASLIQRRLRIGYPRAARLLDQLEEMGVVGPSPGGGREREVLPFEEELEE